MQLIGARYGEFSKTLKLTFSEKVNEPSVSLTTPTATDVIKALARASGMEVKITYVPEGPPFVEEVDRPCNEQRSI